MTDNDLITEVRESFTGVRSATGVDRIESRGRALRARRRAAGLAGALTVGAATAATVTAPWDQPVISPATRAASG